MLQQQREQWSQAVTAHAQKNWHADGWDYVFECWAHDEIVEELIKIGCTTESQAIQHFAWIAGLWDERRQEVCSEIF